MAHDCQHSEDWGRMKEFISATKGVHLTLGTIAFSIVIQVCTFLYLWGGLTTTVKNHDTILSSVCRKLDSVKLVGYVYADEKKPDRVQE